jgi:hypothetical protein
MRSKIINIFLNSTPILVMIGLIPLVANDYVLAGIYIVILVIAFLIKRELNDLTILVFGFFVMIVSEFIFVSTGVEIFQRRTLFGLMPLWLPILWAYGFVAIKRGVMILSAKQ